MKGPKRHGVPVVFFFNPQAVHSDRESLPSLGIPSRDKDTTREWPKLVF